MATTSLPAAFAHLLNERNLAADAALSEVLPHLEPPAQSAAFELLVKRAHIPTLTTLVGRFGDFDEGLQGLIVAGADRLSAALRVAVLSPILRQRANAIAIITASNSGKLAYLLAEALLAPCRKTRELAATALYQMTARLEMKDADAHAPQTQLNEPTTQGNLLGEALATGVRRWETHFQLKVLEAALWLIDLTEPVILEKLGERRTKIALALRKILTGTADPRLARAVLRFLAVPPLREAAAQAISAARDPLFLQAVLAETPLLDDPRIEHACRWIHGDRWIPEAVRLLLHGDESDASGAVRMLAASGATHEGKAEACRELIESGRSGLRQAALRQLLNDESEAATRLLTVLATRCDKEVAQAAGNELHRRVRGVSPSPTTQKTPPIRADDLRASDAFEHFWSNFNNLTVEQRAQAAPALHERVPKLSQTLRNRLRSASPLDRAQALRMILSLQLCNELAEAVYPLVYDPDAVVRGCAVTAVAELPGATTRRLLHAAINDPDERVQANAIEALDRLDIEERVELTRPKLNSPNGRVRASAVKSLLRAEVHQAGETLLEMLEDRSMAQRLGALWVVESLGLRGASGRVHNLSVADPDERVRAAAGRVLEGLRSNVRITPPPPTWPNVPEPEFFEKGLSAIGVLSITPRMAEGFEAIRARFQKGDSIVAVLLALLVLAGVVALALFLSRRQQRRGRLMQEADPARLFDDLLTKLAVSSVQRQMLDSVATTLRLKQPSVLLLSPALFDRYVGQWETRRYAGACGPVRDSRLEPAVNVRRTLFPPSEG